MYRVLLISLFLSVCQFVVAQAGHYIGKKWYEGSVLILYPQGSFYFQLMTPAKESNYKGKWSIDSAVITLKCDSIYNLLVESEFSVEDKKLFALISQEGYQKQSKRSYFKKKKYLEEKIEAVAHNSNKGQWQDEEMASKQKQERREKREEKLMRSLRIIEEFIIELE